MSPKKIIASNKTNPAELRRQAEKKLGKQKTAATPMAKADTLRLVHELQVHQIELEMQNEELVRARTESEAMYRQYTDLYDFAPTGYFTLAQDGSILKVNLAGSNLLGLERDKLARRRLGLFVSVESRPAFNDFFQKLLSGEGKQVCELAFEKNGNGPIWARLVATCFEGGDECRAVVMDITERKQAEEALRESEKNHRELIDGMNDTVWVIDFDGNLIDVNRTAVEVTGYSKEDLLAIGVYGIDSSLKKEDIKALVKAMPADKVQIFETVHKTKDGRSFPVEISSSLVTYYGKHAILSIAKDITERKQVEEALRASEVKFRQTFDVSPVGIVMVGLDKRFIRCNLAFSQSLGYGIEELVGKLIEDVTLPEDKHIGMAEMMTIMKGEIAKSQVHKRYIRKDGQVVWSEVTISVIRDSEGRAQYFLAIIQNITERKQAEEALRASEDKFKHFFEHSTVGKSLTLPTGEVNANQALCGMLGYSLSEFKNKKWQEITHADDIELTQKEVDQLLSGKRDSMRFIKRFLHKDGSVVWVDLSSSIRRDADGKPLYFMSSVIDITARVQAEETLRETSKHLSHMLANSPTVIYDLKVEDGEIIPNWISNNIESVLGFSAEDGLQPEWWSQQIYPEDRPNTLVSLEHLFDDFYQHEYRFLRKDGSLIWLHDEHRLLRNADNKPEEIIGAWTNVTERKRAEEEILKLNVELEQRVEARTSELREAQEKLIRNEKLAVLGQLAGSVGHELRNPLAVINNALYYLKLVGADGGEKVKEYLGIIQTETHTCEKIITDLLDFARIKSVDLEPVSVFKLAERVLERYPAPKAVHVTLEIPKDLPMLHVDPRQMEQVLGNLVINACQAMSTGGELTISAHQEQEMIVIAVKDSGVGISSENMKKLFEPLFTTKAKGIGLGLAVSQKLTEANGGRIEVESEAGVGSTFMLVLPVKQ